MPSDGWLWTGWVVYFALVEARAIVRKRRGDPDARTLTDFVQMWRDFRAGSFDIGRFTLACGFVWLIGHFFGWW